MNPMLPLFSAIALAGFFVGIGAHAPASAAAASDAPPSALLRNCTCKIKQLFNNVTQTPCPPNGSCVSPTVVSWTDGSNGRCVLPNDPLCSEPRFCYAGGQSVKYTYNAACGVGVCCANDTAEIVVDGKIVSALAIGGTSIAYAIGGGPIGCGQTNVWDHTIQCSGGGNVLYSRTTAWECENCD